MATKPTTKKTTPPVKKTAAAKKPTQPVRKVRRGASTAEMIDSMYETIQRGVR